MRKLLVLKSLIDYLWILTGIPLLVIMPIVLVLAIVQPTELISFSSVLREEFETRNLTYVRVYITLVSINILIGVYCLYTFRKTLRYFQRSIPFHSDVIDNFRKMGKLLIVLGLIGGLGIFLAQFLLSSRFVINVISPYVLIICLGLFFTILSEQFLVAKRAKEENELTV